MGINMEREKFIHIGFIKRSQIMAFCKCGYKKADAIYDLVKQEAISKGKFVNDDLGVRTQRLIKLLDLSESEILRLAKEERQKEKDTPTV